MTEAEKQRDLESLQDDIYREKVLRARAMTPREKLSATFELTNQVLKRMRAGAMWQLKIEDEDVGRLENAKRIARLRQVSDFEYHNLAKQ